MFQATPCTVKMKIPLGPGCLLVAEGQNTVVYTIITGLAYFKGTSKVQESKQEVSEKPERGFAILFAISKPSGIFHRPRSANILRRIVLT